MPDPFSWSPILPYLAAALAFGYLCGSIPFGLILTRVAGLGDVRAIGSGNIGATNVLRTGNKKLAAATLLADVAKGALAAWVGTRWGPDTAVMAGLGAFVGHIWPVWLKFRGGKGVATFIGVLAGLFWPAALVFCAIWLVVALVSRYSSLSALTALPPRPWCCCGSRSARSRSCSCRWASSSSSPTGPTSPGLCGARSRRSSPSPERRGCR